MRSLAICAITFRRPAGLGALLDGIAALDEPPDTDVRVVIVDNDPEGSAAATVDAHRARVRWPIDYAVEARRGIPHARNRAVELAGTRDVVFIDDDEVPEPDWLTELLRVADETGADIVTGPVLPRFEDAPAPWLAPFFERPRFADRTEIGYARTSSVLIGRAAIPTGEPVFTPTLAITGGSDTHFFMRAVDRGHRIVWADLAIVHELMPASRVNPRWLLRREYRRGNTLSLCLRDLHDSWPARGKRAARAGMEMGAGAAMVLGAPLRGRSAVRARALRGAQRIALALGMLAGLVNVRYEEYATVHGG